MAKLTDPTSGNGTSKGIRILVVEDEAVIAVYLEILIAELGYEVVGPAYDLPSALAAVENSGFDCALVDINLGRVSAAPVAEALIARGVPFALSTGADQRVIAEFAAVPLLSKPFNVGEVQSMIRRLVSDRVDAVKTGDT